LLKPEKFQVLKRLLYRVHLDAFCQLIRSTEAT